MVGCLVGHLQLQVADVAEVGNDWRSNIKHTDSHANLPNNLLSDPCINIPQVVRPLIPRKYVKYERQIAGT